MSLTCPYCGLVFDSPRNLRRHRTPCVGSYFKRPRLVSCSQLEREKAQMADDEDVRSGVAETTLGVTFFRGNELRNVPITRADFERAGQKRGHP